MDEVFRSLADPTRRGLLDELFREDGQTLTAREAQLPMSRFGVNVESDWTPGSRYEGNAPEAGVSIMEGQNLEMDPPHRLVQSFDALWSDEVRAEPTSRVTWEIEQVADSCRLTVVHDQLRED